jgi:uncharacterized membrane protein
MKNYTPMKNTLAILKIILFSMIFLISTSSFKTEEHEPTKKRITKQIVIEKPCAEVYSYLGNSDNAKSWSVFVAFIETLNSEEVPDGMVGSKRICYTKDDKSGFRWEEEILAVEADKYRKLSCYNFENLSIPSNVLLTEQIYKIHESGCELTFTLDYKEDPSLMDKIKLYFGSFKIKRIFRKNLSNIRDEILLK